MTVHRRLAAVAVVATVLPPLLVREAPELLTPFRAYVLGAGLCFAAMALSLNLLVGYAGQLSLGHGAVVGAGAFASGVVTGRLYLPLVAGVVVAALVGAVLALLVGLPALRLRGVHLGIATVAFAAMMEQSFFRWPLVTGGGVGGIVVPRPAVGGYVFVENGDYLSLAVLLVAVLWWLDSNLTRSKVGRAWLALRDSEVLARAAGVDVARYKLLAFGLAGATGGVAGAVHSHLLRFASASSYSFEVLSLPLLMVVVVAGLGSRPAIVVAGALYVVAPAVVPQLQGWDLIVGGLLGILALTRFPGGLAEEARTARDRRRRRAAARVEARPPRLPDLWRGTASAPAAALEVRDLTVDFHGVRALDGLSLTVQPGSVLGIVGPNGAGKTTLLDALSGFAAVGAGAVLLDGRDVTQAPPQARRRFGMVRTFQLRGLPPRMAVRDALLLAQHCHAGYAVPSAVLGLPAARRREADLQARAAEALEALALSHHAGSAIGTLSVGEQRLVELAGAMLASPRLLLLDEPAAGLSPAAAEDLAGHLAGVAAAADVTVVVVEHHLPLVLEVCSQVCVLAGGRVVAQGAPQEVVRRTEVAAAYLGDAA